LTPTLLLLLLLLWNCLDRHIDRNFLLLLSFNWSDWGGCMVLLGGDSGGDLLLMWSWSETSWRVPLGADVGTLGR